VVGATIASAVSGTPEIDRASATLQLSGTLTQAGCVGEDKVDYVTFSGSWKGGETQSVPDATDYSLTGSVTVSGIKWTINSATKRGVLTAAIALTKSLPAGVVTVYSGRLTLVTQGMPSSTAAAVTARGWIQAPIKLPDEGAAAEDFLIANTEFKITPGGANGQFGDNPASLGIKDFSTVTNVAPLAADGTC
jgi:hypothetical protein